MKIFIIGGTGLLGSEAVKQFIKNGHHVQSLALENTSSEDVFLQQNNIIIGDYLKLSDDDFYNMFKGFDVFIFASGIDERVNAPFPIYDLYEKYNIKPLDRMLTQAKRAGVKHAVVLGSYFSHFNKVYPRLKLTEHHPYIKSRVDQQTLALSHSNDHFDVAVLQIPYVFGIQEGRAPVWMILVDILLSQKKKTYYTKGGTAMVTSRQVGEAIYGAAMKNKGANAYPLGYYNLTWKEMLEIAHQALGFENRKIVTVPTFLYKLYAMSKTKEMKKNNIDPGLNLVKYANLQAKKLFIDKQASIFLGVTDDDIHQAIKDSVKLSKEILENKHPNIIKMTVK